MVASANENSVVRLADIADAHIDELAAFFVGQAPPGADGLPRVSARLRWMAGNPARTPSIPLGWSVREETGAVVGAMLCVPFRYLVGERAELFLMNSAFYVSEAHRGVGGAIFQAFIAFQEQHVLYCSTAHELAGRIWQARRAQMLPKTDFELVGALRTGPLLEEAAHRRLKTPGAVMARAVGGLANLYRPLKLAPHRTATLRLLVNPEEAEGRGGLVASAEAGSGGLTLLRDSSFLRWRYFDVPEPRSAIYEFRSGEETCFIGVSWGARGYRGQVRVVNIADIWGPVSESALSVALSTVALASADTSDAVVLRCPSDPCERVAIKLGFKRRAFEHPIGWYLDRRGILPGHFVLPPAGTEMV
ncbi:MAG: hypothetical protein ABSD20_13500 [Terriglobales bacterium]|jgi:hypothetical protein